MASSLFNHNQQEQTARNPLQAIMEMVRDKDPQQVFFDECKKRGADPQQIINLAKQLRK